MKNKIIIFVLALAFIMSAFAASATPAGNAGIYSNDDISAFQAQQDAARRKDLKPFLDSGIVNEKGVEKALTYPGGPYNVFYFMSKAMHDKMKELGANKMSDLAGNKKALEEVRKAGVEVLEQGLNVDSKQAGEKLDGLINSCGCLPDMIESKKLDLMSIPLLGLPETFETPAAAT